MAFLTLLERKLLGIVGLRLGPNKVSVLGILQPIADAGKLANKQVNMISNFSFFFYYIRALFILSGSIYLWETIGTEPSVVSVKFRILMIIIILGLNSLNSIVCGWRTFRKYSLLGSVRTLAQLISYEGVLYLCLFFLVFFCCSFNIYTNNFHMAPVILLVIPYCFYIWFPSILAELNRTPYDFSEGERELVSGFNTEFGSGSFTLIFLSEYRNIVFFSVVSRILFFHFQIFTGFIYSLFFIIWIRSVLPRFRFDKLMYLAWKFFIPFLTIFFIIFSVLLL